jgi:hypothetical protein
MEKKTYYYIYKNRRNYLLKLMICENVIYIEDRKKYFNGLQVET